jgi:3-hydroxyisobutyrate dehydrogenase-like beta-hydroxyacid dehydrogenase
MARDDVVVGFIGLGIMGGRMAANLQKAGYKLVVHDLQRQAASHHLDAGAAWADNPRALASRTDVIFSSLPARCRSGRARTGTYRRHETRRRGTSEQFASRQDCLSEFCG